MTTTLTPHLRHREPRRVSAAGFMVVLHEGVARSARALPGQGRLGVIVADARVASPMATDLPGAFPASSTSVWCHADGSIQVRATWAPPTLLVRDCGTVMVPQTPGTPGIERLARGDRLLILSAAAFEAAPEAMVRLLHEGAVHLLAADPARLLDELFREAPHAGGAVVTRTEG
jgi:hypothetical protein